MFETPTLWGLMPLFVFVVLVFRKWHPVVAISIAVIVGAIMCGEGIMSIASSVREGLSSFLGYIGLIIMSGAGLGKIAEKTGAAQNLVQFIMFKIKINTPTKAILGTMFCSMLLVGFLGTLAGANAVLAPVIIPIVAAVGLSSSVVAVIFQGAGTTGLWLGPFTPPMVTIMKLTGLSYTQILLKASLPFVLIVWITTYIYCKKILRKSLVTDAYSQDDVASLTLKEENLSEEEAKRKKKITSQATFAFLFTLIALITYGIIVKGGSTFAIGIILTTAIVTGIAGRLRQNVFAETFFEGAKPLVWLFFEFVLFTPFIKYIEKLGGFKALMDLLLTLTVNGGKWALLNLANIIGVAGIPGSSVAQMTIVHKMFGTMVADLAIPMTMWALVLWVGSQMTEFLYPMGDTLGAMGIARSKDIKNMIIFGIVASVPTVLMVMIVAIFI